MEHGLNTTVLLFTQWRERGRILHIKSQKWANWTQNYQ